MSAADTFRADVLPRVRSLRMAKVVETPAGPGGDEPDLQIRDDDHGIRLCVEFTGGASSFGIGREEGWTVLSIPAHLPAEDPEACADALRAHVRRGRRKSGLSAWLPRVGGAAVAILGLLFAYLAIPSAEPGEDCEHPLGWRDAALLEGETVAVEGELVRVEPRPDVAGEPVFLSLGGTFPSPARFDIPVFESYRRRNAGLDDLREGMTVCVIGEVQLFGSDRVPQIVPEAPGSLVIE